MNRKNWSSAKIYSRILNNKTKKTYWANIHELRRRPTQEVFDQALSLIKSESDKEKIIGIDVLAQLGFPKRFNEKKAMQIYFEILKTETNPKVIASTLSAFGHKTKALSNRQILRLRDFKNHRYSDVRYYLVQALGGIEKQSAIEILIELSKDRHSEVRDWATFNLGSQIEMNNSMISEALWARVSDKDINTRREAIAGLAQRKDPRVKEILIEELQNIDEYGSIILESIEEFGDTSFIALLEVQIKKNKKLKSINEQWLIDSLETLKKYA